MKNDDLINIKISEKEPDLSFDEHRYPVRYTAFSNMPPVYHLQWSTGEHCYLNYTQLSQLCIDFAKAYPTKYEKLVNTVSKEFNNSIKTLTQLIFAGHTDVVALRS